VYTLLLLRPQYTCALSSKEQFAELSFCAGMPCRYGTANVTSIGELVSALDEAGYLAVDTAESYYNEAEIGKGLDLSTSARPFITSKVWQHNHAAEHVRAACEKSLADLGVDQIDLYLVHWMPSFDHSTGFRADPSDPDSRVPPVVTPEPPIEETWGAMEALLKEGKVRAIGVANCNIPMLEKILSFCEVAPMVNQCELHPLFAQHELVSYCTAHGCRMTAYSPLGSASGVQDILKNSVLNGIAEETGRTVAQVALRWQVQRGVVVIPKSVRCAQSDYSPADIPLLPHLHDLTIGFR
jgi:diketogulonate reductase-like aldo/keto reductase